jgi:formamidopyrimidine-DNA glycosylase
LKPLLLDQSFVAGLGNIYVDESLHRSGLHPLSKSERVKPAQAALLHREIRAVLAEAIEREGSSFDTFYRTPEGNPGAYQDQFRVYGRGGEPCHTCATPIARLVVGQRGTHVCPRCQPRPRRAR